MPVQETDAGVSPSDAASEHRSGVFFASVKETVILGQNHLQMFVSYVQ